jgi:small subunit ribosomal protein S2
MEEDGDFGTVIKKEINAILKEKTKLEKNLLGIKDMTDVPGAMFIIDTKKESIAVAEAKKLAIPAVGIVDTNCDPDDVTHPIPGNDDAIRAIKLFTTIIADAVLDAKARVLEGREVPGTELGASDKDEASAAPLDEPAPEGEEDEKKE